MRSFLPLSLAGLLLPAVASGQVRVDWVSPTVGVSIAVDAACNAYTVDSTYAQGGDMTLTRHDVNGNLLWVASYDQTDPTMWESASWVTTDSAGDIVMCGTLMSGFSNPVPAASVVMKFAPDGTFLWRQVYEGGFDGSYTRKCLVDRFDDVYVLGTGSGPAGYTTKIKKFAPDGTSLWSYFDVAGIGLPIQFKLTPDDHLVVTAAAPFGSVLGFAKLDLLGNEVWSLPGVYSLTSGDASGDSAGNTYVVHGEYVFNGVTVIKKLDPTGSLVWEQTYGLHAQRVEVGRDDRPVIAGFPLSGAGAAFLKADPSGNVVWENLDADGSINLLLHSQLVLDASDDAYLSAGTLFDMAICKVDSDGTSAWTQTIPGGSARGMALSPNDASVFCTGGNTARLVDLAEGPWENLGQGLAGTFGVPLLTGSGDLTAGSTATLALSGSVPGAPGFLVLGFSALYLPLFGGVLVPAPDLVLNPGRTDGSGGWQLSATWPSGVPSGFELYLQAWVADASAPRRLAGSNGLVGRSP